MMDEVQKSQAIAKAIGREPALFLQSFEISTRSLVGYLPFTWETSAQGLEGLGAPHDTNQPGMLYFATNGGLLTLSILVTLGYGLFVQCRLHAIHAGKPLHWKAEISETRPEVGGTTSYDGTSGIHFLAVPPTSMPSHLATTIELWAEADLGEPSWELNSLLLTPFTV